ncbi:MAG: respiratory nitrate reductase subunit gamma [Micrococcales bacterium]|nr:respiratory nitrate reductase subunit gamma [Micrococcales bacterium]
MSTSVLVFAVWPYIALTVFVVGHVWRWRRDQAGWTSRTSQLLEPRGLRLASPLFHFGALAVVGGHALGLVVPARVTAALGLTEHGYHVMALVFGLVAGVAMATGLVMLVIRRFRYSERLRLVTTRLDWAVYGLLVMTAGIGLWATFGENLVGGGYDYRETISVWFRSLFVLSPDVDLMAAAPFVFRLHVAVAFGFVALWPFTRLVHVWSVPLGYLVRPYVVYRQAGSGTRPAVTRTPWA